jgi:nitrite reductase/ring-hydroxylating ferredoxin subunit
MPEYRLLGATKLKDGEKRILSAGKKKILVLRREGALLSFQRSCPHARALSKKVPSATADLCVPGTWEHSACLMENWWNLPHGRS